MTLLLVASMILPALVAGHLLWTAWRGPTTGSPASPLGAAPEAEPELGAVAPSASLIAEAPPPIDATPLLQDLRPMAPPSVDFTLLGVDEDRDAADEALWRAVQRALADRREKT